VTDIRLCLDFGSTYTKLAAFDVAVPRLLATASVPSTPSTDLADGLAEGLAELKGQGVSCFSARYACSSAAGGLAMAVSGLVPELTVEAARLAALGAGAKIVGVFSHILNRSDLAALDASAPDILLLTGGTDGGNRQNLIENAALIAGLNKRFPILIAGNRSAADEAAALLSDFPTVVCDNVMPRFGELSLETVQKEIRKLFLQHIVKAKGLEAIQATLALPLLPTPRAVLDAMELISRGSKKIKGIGDLIGIDPGGATTDVYSLASGEPIAANVIQKGLKEPFAKRTVEGDIGMRYSAAGVVDAAGIELIEELSGLFAESIKAGVLAREADPALLPVSDEDDRLDRALITAAVKTALVRHAGVLEEVYTPLGKTYLQTGKDLRGVSTFVLTGGPLTKRTDAKDIVLRSLSAASPALLPSSADFLIDRRYILSALGLLSQAAPEAALCIMLEELSP
jgi:uncharacterized protein (TIGR01319 family)